MPLKTTLDRWRNTLSELGIGELICFAPEYLSELLRHRQDRFDQRYGTDTNRSVPVAGLDGAAAAKASAELYWPVREKGFREMMAAVDEPLESLTFIDVGSGKGRGLLLAAEMGRFRRILGIEFSPGLCAVAEANVALFRRARPDATAPEVLCQDAMAYAFPPEPLCLFLFDPFGPAVLEPMVRNLVASLRQHPRPCRVAYYLPMHRAVFESAGFTVVAERRRNLRMAYPWVVLRSPSR